MTYAPPPAASAPVSANPPGRSLGIAGLVLAIIGIFIAFLFPIIGLILSIVGKVQSNRAGIKNTPATAGIIISIIVIVLNIITLVVIISLAAGAVGDVVATCNQLGPGTHVVNGITYTCN